MLIISERTNVGDGLRTSRSIKGIGVCIRRGDVGIAPYTHIIAKRTNVGDGLPDVPRKTEALADDARQRK